MHTLLGRVKRERGTNLKQSGPYFEVYAEL